MAKEYTRDASEYGQQLIADAINKVALGVSTDTTLSVAGKSADAKAAGNAIGAVDDKIGAVAEDGNYIKASETKDVCENLGILDTRAKTNADAITTNGTAITTLNGLISDDGTTKLLFGKVVTIDAETGAVTLSDPVVEETTAET